MILHYPKYAFSFYMYRRHIVLILTSFSFANYGEAKEKKKRKKGTFWGLNSVGLDYHYSLWGPQFGYDVLSHP